MAKLINFNFNKDFEGKLADIRTSFPLEKVDTEYRTTPSGRISEMKTDALLGEALLNFLGVILTQHVFVGMTASGNILAEFARKGDKEIQVACATKEPSTGEWSFFASEVDKDTKLVTNYGAGHKGTVFLMALMPAILKDSEAMAQEDILKCYDIEDEEFSEALCVLCNNIYYRVKDTKSTAPILFKESLTILSAGQIEKTKVVSTITGSPLIFNLASEEEKEEFSTSSVSTEEIRKVDGLYLYDPEWELSEEESQRVPEFGKWFIPSKLGDEVARKIKMSQNFRRKFDTILFYGPSGTGKTELCKQIACELGLPYYSLCPGTDADNTTLTDSYVPNTEHKDFNTICKELNIPTFEEVEFDFTNSFKKLFGKEAGEFDSPTDCYSEIAERCTRYSGGQDFCHVETELVKCFRNGGLCEIQEADVIKRSSVLTILNPILNGNGKNDFIQLSNGEILRRNKNCIIIFTTNRNYDGCNNLQQSIYSRIPLKREVSLPISDVLFERTKADTGFKGDALLRKMAEVTVNIHKYCLEKDITSGVAGPRELGDWAIDTILNSEIAGNSRPTEEDCIAAALETILETVSQDADDKEDIIDAVFCKTFAPAKVKKAREAMNLR